MLVYSPWGASAQPNTPVQEDTFNLILKDEVDQRLLNDLATIGVRGFVWILAIVAYAQSICRLSVHGGGLRKWLWSESGGKRWMREWERKSNANATRDFNQYTVDTSIYRR